MDDFPLYECHYSSVDIVLDWCALGPCFDTQLGRIFYSLITFKEEMSDMVKNKNNNLSNSLVFGRWPRTNKFLLFAQARANRGSFGF